MLTALAAHTAFAHPWVHGGPGFGPFLFGFIPLFWITAIVVIVLLVARGRRRRWASGFTPWGPGAPWAHDGVRAAETVLAERFARGDIDEVEYRARLEVLRAGRERPQA